MKLASAESRPTDVRWHARLPAAIFRSDCSMRLSLKLSHVHKDPNQKIPSSTKPSRNPPCTLTQSSIEAGRSHSQRLLSPSPAMHLRSVESRIQNQISVKSQLKTCGRARK